MKIKEGKMPFEGFQTYYRIVHPHGKKIPLLLLHGGPGSTHNYFEVLDDLAEMDDRPLIMYDQIGCGESMVTGHPELFNAKTWMAELIQLRKHLQLDNLHILGQSWGGMLAIWYALEKNPTGIKSYILSSTLSSARLWKQEQHRRITYLPEDMQLAINVAEESGDYTSPEYLRALDEFMHRHCLSEIPENSPECLRRPRATGAEAYLVGWGPNEFTPTGTLSGYEFTKDLCQINEPCLITSGQRDLCSPYIAKTMYDNLPNAKWELFPYSGHMPFVEETEQYMKVLIQWLNQL